MPNLSRQEIQEMLRNEETFWAVPVAKVQKLRAQFNIGKGVAFASKGTIEVDVRDLDQAACDTPLGAVCELTTKNIFNPFRNGHVVSYSMGPQMRGPRDHFITDETAHTVTTFSWPKGKIVVTITFVKPEVAAPAAAGGGGFR